MTGERVRATTVDTITAPVRVKASGSEGLSFRGYLMPIEMA